MKDDEICQALLVVEAHWNRESKQLARRHDAVIRMLVVLWNWMFIWYAWDCFLEEREAYCATYPEARAVFDQWGYQTTTNGRFVWHQARVTEWLKESTEQIRMRQHFLRVFFQKHYAGAFTCACPLTEELLALQSLADLCVRTHRPANDVFQEWDKWVYKNAINDLILDNMMSSTEEKRWRPYLLLSRLKRHLKLENRPDRRSIDNHLTHLKLKDIRNVESILALF